MRIIELLDIVRSKDSEYDWDDAWDRLSTIGPESKSEVPLLFEALNDTNEHVRLFALRALVKIGADIRVALPSIISMLGEGNSLLKLEALRVLGRYGKGNQDVRSALRHIMRDEHAYCGMRFRALLAYMRC